MKVDQNTMLRFLSKTERLEREADQECGCLLWRGARTRGGGRCGGAGYGSFSVNARWNSVRAHVFSATQAGLIVDFKVPGGHNLHHNCRRSLCVEPRHLELVTAEANLADRHQNKARPVPEQGQSLVVYALATRRR